jgi:hypothetical protein
LDWEPRHPADFYRGRSDAHKLPWTRPDDGADPGGLWANPQGAITAVTTVVDPNETKGTLQLGNYRVNTTTGKTEGNAMLVFFNNTVSGVMEMTPKSTTSSVGSTLTLPTTPTTGGNIILRTSYGQILSIAPIVALTATVGGLSWTRATGHLLVSFQFGT